MSKASKDRELYEEMLRLVDEHARTVAGRGPTSEPATATIVDTSGPSSTTPTPMITIPAKDFREMVDCMMGLMEGVNRLHQEVKELRTTIEAPFTSAPIAGPPAPYMPMVPAVGAGWAGVPTTPPAWMGDPQWLDPDVQAKWAPSNE